MLAPPIARIEVIDKVTLNGCLVAWEHKMGPWTRPTFRGWFHGLFHHDELVAVTAAGDLIRPNTVGGLTRADAFELARVCAKRPHLCRPMLRLWRELIFPALCAAHGWSWAISYQDAVLHSGNLYRHDGWCRIGYSASGNDHRSGRKGRCSAIGSSLVRSRDQSSSETGGVSMSTRTLFASVQECAPALPGVAGASMQ